MSAIGCKIAYNTVQSKLQRKPAVKNSVGRNVLICASLILCLTVVCVFAGCKDSQSTEYDLIKKTKMRNYEFLNKRAQKGQIVLIGDSIIELYPEEMLGQTDVRVYNRGISGDCSDRMLERLDSNALNISPSQIFILVGTNDLSRGISADTVADNISKAIDRCIVAGVKDIVISSLLPVNKDVSSKMVGSRNNRQINDLNAKIAKLCEEKNVIYLDVNPVVADENGNFDRKYTYDGLHPNANGYALINAELLKVFGIADRIAIA